MPSLDLACPASSPLPSAALLLRHIHSLEAERTTHVPGRGPCACPGEQLLRGAQQHSRHREYAGGAPWDVAYSNTQHCTAWVGWALGLLWDSDSLFSFCIQAGTGGKHIIVGSKRAGKTTLMLAIATEVGKWRGLCPIHVTLKAEPQVRYSARISKFDTPVLAMCALCAADRSVH